MVNDSTEAAESRGLTLGVLAVIGSAMNNRDILNELKPAEGNREQFRRIASGRAHVDLNDEEINTLIEKVNGKSILDLIQDAKDCLAGGPQPPPYKWRY